MAAVPYARTQPYDNSAYVRAMADLMIRQGETAAAARLMQGQNKQQMWQGLGQTATATMASMMNSRDEQQKLRMAQAEADRNYALKQQEMKERQADREADLDWRNRQFNEARADKAADRVPVGDVLSNEDYTARGFPGTSAASSFEPQGYQAARLPATAMADTMGYGGYSDAQGITDFAMSERLSMSPDVAERPEGMKRIASQSELVQLENLRRQAEAAQLAAENVRGDNLRAKLAAEALERYRDAQLKLSGRRAAAAEQNASKSGGGVDQVIQTPTGWALVDKGTGQTKPVLGPDGQPMKRYADTGNLGTFQNVVSYAIGKLPPAKQPAVIATVERMLQEESDPKRPELLGYLKKTVTDNLSGSERQQVMGRDAAIASLNDARAVMQQLQAAGVNTGLLGGKVEDVKRYLGKTGDPRLVELGTQLANSLGNYRRAMTGLAFSDTESKDYAKQWPSYLDEFPVNMAKIDGLIGAMGVYDRRFWELNLGPSAAGLFGNSSPAPAPSAKPKVTKDMIPGKPGG